MRNTVLKSDERYRFIWRMNEALSRLDYPAGVSGENKHSPHRAERVSAQYLCFVGVRLFVRFKLFLQLLHVHIDL